MYQARQPRQSSGNRSAITVRDIDLGRIFPIRRPALPGGRWLIAIALLAVLLSFFAACGVFTQPVSPSPRGSFGATLFFSVTIAYIVPVCGFISERTITALANLTPVLDADPATVERWQQRIARKPLRWLATVLAIGISAGVVHNLAFYTSFAELWREVLKSPPIAALVMGTQLIWVVLTLAVSALLDNAVVLNHAARCARVRPFDGMRLRPFAAIAVMSTLSLIGAQAAFPIMSIEGGVDLLAYIPGLLGTGGPMLLMAALPVWPVHRRLATTKRQILADLDRRISVLPLPDPGQPESLASFTRLLIYRREVEQIRVWPFDLGVLSRLALYLIIPPLTWIGAAIIEHVVDVLL